MIRILDMESIISITLLMTTNLRKGVKSSTRLWIEKKVPLLAGLPDGTIVDLGCRV
jgi:hypothetical protein